MEEEQLHFASPESAKKQPSKPLFTSVKRKTVILIIIFTLCIIGAFVIGVAVSMARINSKFEELQKKMKSMKKESQPSGNTMDKKIHHEILADLQTSNLRDNLRYFSMKPHTAGMARNNELGDEIHRRFKSYGFKSEQETFNVLLSYPRKDKPNAAHLLDDKNKRKYTTRTMESILEPNENSSLSVQPFNAYSPAKTVEGDLVYANYGREKDFKILKEQYNVSCKGKIVIVRYGKVFRGAKVRNAQRNGAIGVLIYNDPADYGPVPDSGLFPNSWWMPRDGVQRGSILPSDGDPTTPGYPSLDGVYRYDPQLNASKLQMPGIPSHPISANDAYQFLRHMGGSQVKHDGWKGKLKLQYRVGPGFAGNKTTWKVKVEVHNVMKMMKITNVIGTIRGSVEPDRYVLVGNHRDSWVFGATDAVSGTTVMMEMARAFGAKVKKGWRPRRSIKFCSWDGEEHNIIGSTEFVERHISLLRDRAVAYMNLDCAVYGNYSLNAAASPLIIQTILDASRKTMDPFESMTVLEKAKRTTPSRYRPGEPAIRKISSGSDFVSFYHVAGVPSLDFSYGMQQIHKKYNTSFYPVYHSLHDTFYWMTKFVDPTFKCHQTVARVATNTLLSIADSPLIPWNVNDFASELERGVKVLKEEVKKKCATNSCIDTKPLDRTVKHFAATAEKFHKSLKTIHLNDTLTLRSMNDRLMQLEKAFIVPGGLPGRPQKKHLVFAPSIQNSYAGTLFSGVTDQLVDVDQDPAAWNNIKVHLSIVIAHIEAAAETLEDDLGP